MKERREPVSRRRRKALGEKILMAALPLAALAISYMIIAPQLGMLLRHMDEEKAAEISARQSIVQPVPAAQSRQAAYSPSTQSADIDSCGPDQRRFQLSASSMERDILVQVLDENGNAVTGERLEIVLSSPVMGQQSYFTTENGSCYIVELYPGEYSVSLAGSATVSAEAISCQVKAAASYQAIPDISELLGIVDISQMPVTEIKDNTPDAPVEVVPEVIYTPEESVQQETAVLDPMGRPVYTYSCNVGPNGFLLLRGSGTESDVIPVDENNDGVVDYGLRYVLPEAPPEGMEDESGGTGGYYVSVTLFNADNSPVELYDITAIPLTQPAGGSLAGWQSENGSTYYRDASGSYVTGLKSIDGKLYYFDYYGRKASRLGVDVSCFNGSVNWSAVKAQGIDFAIVRVGGRGWESGLVYEDSMALDHIRGAKAAGLKVGVYFYSTAIDASEAIQEASVVIEMLGGTGLDMPVYIDMEYSGDFPYGRADTLGTAQRVEIINAFCKTIVNSGYTAGVYSGESLLTHEVDYNSIAQYSVWLANYTENNSLPSYPHSYHIWQFTDRGVVTGMGGNVDLNVIF